MCLIFRWLDDFDKPGPDWGFAEAAADALDAALRDPMFIDNLGAALAGFDLIDTRHLHFLGHSRGTVVNSEVVERFGVAGILVDHVTTFDPHPMNGTLDPPVNYDWGDPMPSRWSNIVFHDNYWRADGGWLGAFDPDGIPIAGAFNVELDESTLNSGGYSGAHSDTHLWYHGTIDLAPMPCDGEVCITAAMRAAWWPSGYTEVGYYYSRIGGGVASRPAQGPIAAPGPVPSLYGGDFPQASQAGWRFHGGSLDAAIVSEGGRTFLKLGPSQGNSAIHNWFHLPAGAAAITLSHRILGSDDAGGDDALKLRLIDRDGIVIELTGALDLTQPAGDWLAGTSFGIPSGLMSDRAYRLQIGLDGGTQVNATVGVDDIVVSIINCPADLNTDGIVNVLDLLAMLGGWGSCSACPADLNADGAVNVLDLLEMLGQWGPC